MVDGFTPCNFAAWVNESLGSRRMAEIACNARSRAAWLRCDGGAMRTAESAVRGFSGSANRFFLRFDCFFLTLLFSLIFAAATRGFVLVLH